MNSLHSFIPEIELIQRNVRKMSVVAAAFIFCVSSSLSFAQAPYLIFLPLGSDGIAPAKVLQDNEYIESLPIDGVVMTGHTVVSGDKDGMVYYCIWSNQESLEYAQVYDEFAPLKGEFSKLDRSWMFGSTSLKAGDWFDDWSTCLRNFATAARACKDLGLEGILLDNCNDQYHPYPVWEYPSQAAGANKTLGEYRQQVRLRGKQIMEACVKEYPAFKLALMTSAANVEQGDPHIAIRPKAFELLSAFYSGLVAGAGEQGMVIDASVFYNAKNREKFVGSYQFRKYDIPSSLHNSPSIPQEDRVLWSQRLSIGYGLCYGYSEEGMTNALKQCDYMCWYYNGANNLDPETTKEKWWSVNIDRFPSLGRARAAAKAPGVNNVASGIHFATTRGAETIRAIPGDASFRYTLYYENNTGSQESITYLQKPDWVKATKNSATISGVAPTTPQAYTLVAVISADVKSDTLRLTILTSAPPTPAASGME